MVELARLLALQLTPDAIHVICSYPRIRQLNTVRLPADHQQRDQLCASNKKVQGGSADRHGVQ